MLFLPFAFSIGMLPFLISCVGQKERAIRSSAWQDDEHEDRNRDAVNDDAGRDEPRNDREQVDVEVAFFVDFFHARHGVIDGRDAHRSEPARKEPFSPRVEGRYAEAESKDGWKASKENDGCRKQDELPDAPCLAVKPHVRRQDGADERKDDHVQQAVESFCELVLKGQQMFLCMCRKRPT